MSSNVTYEETTPGGRVNRLNVHLCRRSLPVRINARPAFPWSGYHHADELMKREVPRFLMGRAERQDVPQKIPELLNRFMSKLTQTNAPDYVIEGAREWARIVRESLLRCLDVLPEFAPATWLIVSQTAREGGTLHFTLIDAVPPKIARWAFEAAPHVVGDSGRMGSLRKSGLAQRTGMRTWTDPVSLTQMRERIAALADVFDVDWNEHVVIGRVRQTREDKQRAQEALDRAAEASREARAAWLKWGDPAWIEEQRIAASHLALAKMGEQDDAAQALLDAQAAHIEAQKALRAMLSEESE